MLQTKNLDEIIRLKNDTEIAGIRKSCHLLAELFKYLIPYVQVGVSTKEIDDKCKDFIKKHGGKPAWYKEDFPGAACISINDEVIHGVPSKKRIIYDGDIVSLDIGIDLDGYISDSTHSVLVGNVRPEVKMLDDVAVECLYAGIDACRVGNRISDITKAISEIAKKHNYGIVSEYCGHGVGLAVHEAPNIPNCLPVGKNPRIQAGMVLAIEPMLNLGTGDVETDTKDGWTVLTRDGKCSAHEEHTVAVFSDHTEILTELN